jgi:Mn2+/Fe2+ NRAMP family transporter
MTNDQQPTPEDIQLELSVKTSERVLDEGNASGSQATQLIPYQQGQVKELVVEKSLLGQKGLVLPIGQVQAVEYARDRPIPGTVIIQVSEVRGAGSSASGSEAFVPDNQGALSYLSEQEIVAAERARKVKARHAVSRARGTMLQAGEAEARTLSIGGTISKAVLCVLGSGFLAHLVSKDPLARTTDAIDRASAGCKRLRLLVLSMPLYQAVQSVSATIRRATQSGSTALLRIHYSFWVAFLAALMLIITNVVLIAADLVAIDSGIALLTGLPWLWFALPVAIVLWYISVFRSFEAFRKIFMVLSLVFVTYLIAAISSRANWMDALQRVFVPPVRFDLTGLSIAIALLGAIFVPYSLFWLIQTEKERKRPESWKQQLRLTALDVASGSVGGTVIAYTIIICTSATIFARHSQIATVATIAHSLEPLLGPAAKYLFAVALIGAGIVSIPVLLASTSYAVSGPSGWPIGLSERSWRRKGFSRILTGALVISLLLAFLRFDPLRLIFWENVLTGVLAPVLLVYLLIFGKMRNIMGNRRVGQLTNLGLLVAALILLVVALLLFSGLAVRPGG